MVSELPLVVELVDPDYTEQADTEVPDCIAELDYMVAVFEPEAKALLSRIEPVAMHYEVRVSTIGLD